MPPIQGFLQERLPSRSLEAAEGLVEDHQFRPATGQGSGQADALSFASRQPPPVFAEKRCQTLGQSCDDVAQLGGAAHRFDGDAVADAVPVAGMGGSVAQVIE